VEKFASLSAECAAAASRPPERRRACVLYRHRGRLHYI